MRFDMHIHTIFSRYNFWKFESSIKPRELIKFALKRKLDGIAVTDHDTTKGMAACFKENRNLGSKLQVVPGCEIRSKEGHILAYDIKEWKHKKYLPAVEVIEKIKDLGGIAVAAHPYRDEIFKRSLRDLVKNLKLDGIEVLDFNNSKEANRKAMIDASKLKLGRTAGGDAHMIFDVGKVATICEKDIIDAIVKNKTRVEGKESSFPRRIGSNAYRVIYNLLNSKQKNRAC